MKKIWKILIILTLVLTSSILLSLKNSPPVDTSYKMETDTFYKDGMTYQFFAIRHPVTQTYAGFEVVNITKDKLEIELLKDRIKNKY